MNLKSFASIQASVRKQSMGAICPSIDSMTSQGTDSFYDFVLLVREEGQNDQPIQALILLLFSLDTG